MGTVTGGFTMSSMPVSRTELTAHFLTSSIRIVLFHDPRRLGMDFVMEVFTLLKNVVTMEETVTVAM